MEKRYGDKGDKHVIPIIMGERYSSNTSPFFDYIFMDYLHLRVMYNQTKQRKGKLKPHPVKTTE